MSALVKNILYPIIGLIIISCIFSASTLFMNGNDFQGIPADEDDKVKFVNRLYFAMTTISTCGYGDIYPISTRAKISTMILQSLVTVGIVSTIIQSVRCENARIY